ncbi:MAG: hypothetical protein AAB731_01230 [Patescibacteria group bacterium]
MMSFLRAEKKKARQNETDGQKNCANVYLIHDTQTEHCLNPSNIIAQLQLALILSRFLPKAHLLNCRPPPPAGGWRK